jgi:hypothetical protein
VVNTRLYGADSVSLGSIHASIAHHADNSVAGWLSGGMIFNGDGSVRAFLRSNTLYDADGTLLASLGGTIRRADSTVAGQTGCGDPLRSLALTLFGVLSL